MSQLSSKESAAYSSDFYVDQAPGSKRSAEAILPLLFSFVQPRSLIDIGCGVGTWLRASKDLGVSSVLGIDGEYARTAGVLVDEHEFQAADLGLALPLQPGRFDVALCLEVAEHLPLERAPGLVQELCGLSDVVMFSAAIPGQGGTDHINLQPQSAWVEYFTANGYQAFDLVRPYVWADSSVEVWYRQNVLVFVNNGCAEMTERARSLEIAAPRLVDVVHPDLLAFWERRATRPISTAGALRLTAQGLKRGIHRRMRGGR